jgi:DmsE family decaheme c-type cytochrome
VEDSDDKPEIAFGPDAAPGPQNEVCLSCHQRGVAMHWVGGVHEREGVACASCHTIHIGAEAGGDPILSKNVEAGRAPNSQAETCFRCHKQQRAMAYRMSAHPIRYGQMNCSDCHSPHGSVGEMQLVKPTLNETCYTCHAEKRGPFLWEHAPAREDCSSCHTPHGSNHQALLKTRGPWLCQQCHAASRHPSTAYDGTDLYPVSGGNNSSKLQAKNCMSCHPEVHGSNHPSGVRWTR